MLNIKFSVDFEKYNTSIFNIQYSLFDIQRAEREGFEPSVPFSRHTRFPGEPVRPLRHLSSGRRLKIDVCRATFNQNG